MNGAWLWKSMEIQKLTLSLDANHDGESVRTDAEPLLCSPKIEVRSSEGLLLDRSLFHTCRFPISFLLTVHQ